jgi:small-conductance mechanosensitive channel
MWAETLRPFLFSLVALAAAIVLALKELIMCFTGGMLIRVSKTFKEGQRIEVDGIRGFVIERGLLATKILEIGPEKNSQQTTGDFVTIPNSLMLSKSLKNESYFKGFSIKSFVFEIDYLEGVENLEQSLLAKAKEITESYLSEAKESISRFCEKEGIGIPSIEPRTKVLVGECSRVSLLLKIPVQNGRIADIEQDINRFYLDWTIKNVPEAYRAKKK